MLVIGASSMIWKLKSGGGLVMVNLNHRAARLCTSGTSKRRMSLASMLPWLCSQEGLSRVYARQVGEVSRLRKASLATYGFEHYPCSR